MHRLYLFLSTLFLIYFSCSKDPVSSKSTITNLLLNSTVIVNDGNILSKIDLKTGENSIIYSGTDNTIIYSFDYCKQTNSFYLVLHNQYDENHLNTIVASLNTDKMFNILDQCTTCTNCEGFYTYLTISVSPSGKYIVLKGAHYEGGDLDIYNDTENEYLRFNRRPYTEYVEFLVWEPISESAFARSHDYLVKYDVTTKDIEMLSTANIRDYISEDDLLQQGYLGNRINYSELIGTDQFRYLNWVYNKSGFVYQTSEQPNILFHYSYLDSSVTKVVEEDFSDVRVGRNYLIVWNENLSSSINQVELSDDDLIVQFDESVLDTIQALNDSLYYDIQQSYSISYLRPNWNHRYYSWENYFFKNYINAEKFHVAELDFFFWCFALELTPEFWFLLLHYRGNTEMTKDSLITTYNSYVEQYYEDYLFFKEMRYPTVLFENKERYNQLALRDYRCQKVFVDYLKDDNFEALKDSICTILNDEDINLLNSIIDTLTCDNNEMRDNYAKYHKELHNNFLNFYGKVIEKDLEAIKDDLLIERLSSDWLYKKLAKENKYITYNYYKFKIYDIP